MILAFLILAGLAAFMWSVWEELGDLIEQQMDDIEDERPVGSQPLPDIEYHS